MSELKWWQRPVRMMRRDYVTDLQRVCDKDLDELARSFAQDWHINCEWVIGTLGTAPGLGWQVTFATDKFRKFDALGDFDLIREYLPYARKHGIHPLAYLNMHWYSYDFAAEHPGWEQLLADGTPYGRAHPLYGSGTTMCVNSPWRDWAFELVRETMRTGLDGCFLDGPVVFSGACYCEACRARFRKQYGADIPEVEDWADPRWKQFIVFREDSMARFLSEARDAMLQVNPEGVIFLNGGSWHGGAWRVARDIEKVGPFEHFNGAEAFFHPGPRKHILYFWATAAKHLTAAGKPAVVFSHHTLGAWHYLPLPPVEAKLAAAQAVACGANPWLAIFDYAMDNAAEEALAPIREINGFLEQIEPYCTAAKSGADIALLYSSQSAKFYVSEVDDLFTETAGAQERDLGVSAGSGKRVADLNRRKSLCDQWQGNTYLGWFEALTREHIPFDVVLDSGLTDESLSHYRLLILTNASCLSEEQLAAVVRFARSGGSVIASFEAGQYDEMGDRRTYNPLWPLLGVEAIEGAFAPATVEEYIRLEGDHPAAGFRDGRWIPRPVQCLKVRAADAAVPARVLNPIGRVYRAPQGVSDYPAMLCREVGSGRTVYIPALVGAMYADYQIQDHQRWMTSAARWAHGGELPLTARAPGSVQIELWRQPGRRIVHLLNATGDGVRPIAETVPVHDIEIRLPGPPPTQVTLASGAAVRWSREGEHTVIHVDRLEFYDLVIVEE